MSAGYIKLWRCIEDSDVWQLPPLTYRIWTWILMHVNREPATVYGVELQPGEMLTSYAHIAEGVSWYEGKRKMHPTTDTIRWALKKLESYQSLHREPHQGSLLIKVLQWEQYQANNTGDNTRDNNSNHNVTTPGPHQDHTTKQEERIEEERKDSRSLVAHAVDYAKAQGYTKPNAGQLGREAKKLLDAGADYDQLTRAIERMIDQNKAPNLLHYILGDLQREAGPRVKLALTEEQRVAIHIINTRYVPGDTPLTQEQVTQIKRRLAADPPSTVEKVMAWN